jgi:allantoinase
MSNRKWEREASMSNPRIPFQLSSERPRLPPPGGKPLIVHIVVNIEHWPFDRPMPRQIFTPPHGIQPKPDVPNFSWSEYGMRCGLPRLVDLLGRLGVPASTAINASVLDTYPSLADAVCEAGWELMGHGYFQRTLQQEPDERQAVRDSVERLSRRTGKRVRGWLGPGLHETDNTPEILKEAGIDYVCDWALDDLPCWMTTARGPLIAMPYAIELNDTVMYSIDKHGSDEIMRRVTDTVATLESELPRNPRVLTIALHPYAIGVPHRLPYLARAIEFLKARHDSVFMTGSAIADWFIAADAQSRSDQTA